MHDFCGFDGILGGDLVIFVGVWMLWFARIFVGMVEVGFEVNLGLEGVILGSFVCVE